MTNQHPITPPPELVQQLCDSAALSRSFKNISIREVDVLLILEAFQAGADQELEACVELTRDNDGYDAALGLRAARRPKPLTVKEQALSYLNQAYNNGHIDDTTFKNIQKILETLPNE
jgi:hypothetical protein